MFVKQANSVSPSLQEEVLSAEEGWVGRTLAVKRVGGVGP